MQKRSTPNPYLRTKDLGHSRCTSSIFLEKDNKYFKQGYSASEIDTFSLHFSKILRKFLPDFQLPYSIDQLSGILETLPFVLDSISENTASQVTEDYQSKEASLKKASKNLSKYEELLKEKAIELEEDIQAWEQSKLSELQQLDSQKTEMVKARVQLELEIKQASHVLNEREEKVNTQYQEIEALKAEVYSSQIRNRELEWKLEQKLAEVKEKEAILVMKESLIQKDKEEIVQERSAVENEKLVNHVLNLELIRETNASRVQQRCSSTLFMPETNKSHYSETYRAQSASRQEIKNEEPGITVSKQAFSELVSTKKGLERVEVELEEIQNRILPEIHQQSEEMVLVFTEVKELKQATEEYLKGVFEKFDEFERKYEELERVLKENKEKNEELVKKEMLINELEKCLNGRTDELEKEKEKFEVEVEDFQKEKIEYYEDVSKERERIQEYYLGIEEKIRLLDISRIEIESAKHQLKQRETSPMHKLSRYHTNITSP